MAMPCIDVHTHFFPAELPDLAPRRGDSRWPSLVIDGDGRGRIMRGADVFRPVSSTCWDIEARRESMAACNVDVQVLSPVPVTLAYWGDDDLAIEFCRRQNDLLAEAVASDPTRFMALGGVPLQAVDAAIAELDRLVNDLGLSGVEIGTEVAGKELDDLALRPFFAAAQDLDVSLFVHPTDGGGAIRRRGVPYEFGLGMLTDTAMAAAALVFGGVLEAFPRLRVGLAHGCGTFAWSVPRLVNGASLMPNARSRATVDELVKLLWVDTLVFDPTHLPLLFERFGPDHVMLGSDFPFYPSAWGGATAVLDGGVAAGTCTAAQVADIVGANGWRFLGPHTPALDPSRRHKHG